VESISQTTTTAAQPSSAMPTAGVPSSASQPGMSAPSGYQAMPSQVAAMSQVPQALSANSGPAGFGGSSSSQSMAAGVPGAQRKPEYASSLPGPGVVLGVSDTDTSGQFPGNLGFTAPAMGKPGSADLRAGSFDPGLYNSGSTGSAQQPAKPNPKSGTKRKRS